MVDDEMKQISEYTNQGLQANIEKSTARLQKISPSKRTTRLFEVMRRDYGNLWTQQIGSTAEEIREHLIHWERRLESLTTDQIAAGLEAWEDNYPPKPKQFATFCRETTRTLSLHRRPECLALPRPTPSASVVQSCIQKMRESIRG
jgi:hypothetical protein